MPNHFSECPFTFYLLPEMEEGCWVFLGNASLSCNLLSLDCFDFHFPEDWCYLVSSIFITISGRQGGEDTVERGKGIKVFIACRWLFSLFTFEAVFFHQNYLCMLEITLLSNVPGIYLCPLVITMSEAPQHLWHGSVS